MKVSSVIDQKVLVAWSLAKILIYFSCVMATAKKIKNKSCDLLKVVVSKENDLFLYEKF